MEEVDANPGLIFDKLDGWLDGFFRLLPNIGVALVVAVVFWFLGMGIGALIRKSAGRRGRENLGDVGGDTGEGVGACHVHLPWESARAGLG